MTNVFKTLGIQPTDDFITVKKAYYRKAIALHPDKHSAEEKLYEMKFKELQDAWSKVDENQKLKSYYKKYPTDDLDDSQYSYDDYSYEGYSDFYSQASAKHSTEKYASDESYQPKEEEKIQPDAIKPYVNDWVDIFISVNFVNKDTPSNANSSAVFLSKLAPKETPSVDFKDLAELINSQSKKVIFQVGVTYEEAADIEGQHKHWFPQLIVRVKVPITRLSDNKQSEKEKLGSRVLNAKGGEFFWLEKNTIIKAEHILSVQALHAYTNTMCFGHKLGSADNNVENFWPLGYVQEKPPSVKQLGNSNQRKDSKKQIKEKNNLTGSYNSNNNNNNKLKPPKTSLQIEEEHADNNNTVDQRLFAFKQAIDQLDPNVKLSNSELITKLRALHEAIAKDANKNSPSSLAVLKHFTQITQDIYKNKITNIQDLENSLDALDKELYGKPPLSNYIKVAIGIAICALVGLIAGALIGAAVTGWSGGWGALPGAVLGAIKEASVGAAAFGGTVAVSSMVGGGAGFFISKVQDSQFQKRRESVDKEISGINTSIQETKDSLNVTFKK